MGDKKYFLFDRRFQALRENVEMVLAPCAKHPANPLKLDGSGDWCHDNLAGRIRYFPEEGLYKGSVSGNHGVYSTDGIEWERGEKWPGNCELSGDPDQDPARRFKTVVCAEGPGGVPQLDSKGIAACKKLGISPISGIGVGWSSDGLTWQYQYPVLPTTSRFHHYGAADWGGGDGFNHVIWAPTLKKYVLFVRTNIDREPYGGRKERAVGRMESEDLIHWFPHQVCLRPWVDWQNCLGYGKHDFYHLPVFFYAGIYWSIASVFWWNTDTVHLELFWSPDTVFWERVCPYQDFIPQGEVKKTRDIPKNHPPLYSIFSANPRAVDSGCNFAIHEPVFLKDEIRVYYGASPGRHNTDADRRSGLCLATFKPDRFAGAAARGVTPGQIVTRPLDGGAELLVNADAGGGSLRIEVRDEQGTALPGFGLGDCRPISGDVLDAPVRWMGAARLPAGKVTLAIEMERATLYAMSVGS